MVVGRVKIWTNVTGRTHHFHVAGLFFIIDPSLTTKIKIKTMIIAKGYFIYILYSELKYNN